MSCVWVAELGNNHAGSWDRALALIQAAKEVGCDAVKFQLARHDKLWAPEVRASKEHLVPYELPLEWLPEIRKKCDELGLKFGCTPLYLDAVKELEPWVDWFKISSYEAGWWELIDACLTTGMPLVVSIGLMADGELWDWMHEMGNCWSLTILHSVSSYPTKLSECNLSRIGWLKQKFHEDYVKVGLSDHSVNPEVIKRAVLHWGAEMVEFHLRDTAKRELTHDGWVWTKPLSPEWKHSWLPEQIKPVIEFCRVDDGVWPGWEEERKRARDSSDGLRPLKGAR